ncbi:unnamed protein product, partial [Didymodactylos carnosus]
AHRDVKPANMVVDYENGILKICDLGSAKRLNKGEKSVSYVCTRYYRAPELLLGCTEYSAGLSQLFKPYVLRPRYTGSVDLTIISFQPRTLRGYLPERTPDNAFVLLESLLRYKPMERTTCLAALASDFFIELRQRSNTLANKKPLPNLFNFRDNELPKSNVLYNYIVPEWYTQPIPAQTVEKKR